MPLTNITPLKCKFMVHHACNKTGLNVNSPQSELGFNNVRDNPSNRTAFANAFVQVMIAHMNVHFSLKLSTCNPLSTINDQPDTNVVLYPNLVTPLSTYPTG